MISHTCNTCGITDEAQFKYAGPHIKQVCNYCGAYVKFFSKGLLPDHKEIKLNIWSMVKGDTEKTETVKSESYHFDGLSGLELKLAWWRLYLETRESFREIADGEPMFIYNGELGFVAGFLYPRSYVLQVTDDDTGKERLEVRHMGELKFLDIVLARHNND